MQISAVVITKNSASTLIKCLESLQKVADEVIVVDSGSTDLTVNIAEQYGCRVIHSAWLGYGPTKNLGHQTARGAYILSLDSDEELSADLILELNNIRHHLNGVYGFKRLNNYCGKWIRYGAWYPDKKTRLFPNNILWNDSASHEQLILNSDQKITYLSGSLLHYAYRNKEELKAKTYLYASLGAISKKNTSKFAAALKMIFSPIVSFVKSYLIKRGFLDGRFGFDISFYNAMGTFLKYKNLLKS